MTPRHRRQRFWIEKTIVAGRADRENGEHAFGRALWSPQTSKDGKNIYANMLQVQPGDVVFHLTDNEAITSVSIASEAADADFIGLEGSDWAGQPGYRIALVDHEQLAPPLVRSAFLDTEPFALELRELEASGAKGLFYNRSRGLNQGAYLTEATPTLLSILNRAYEAYAGKHLPHTSSATSPAVSDTKPYSLTDALELLFIEERVAEDIQNLWSAKKNIILQGPPGVGKSFAAQKLAFALMGAEDRKRLGFVQFHQSYSYEDFVEGFRPDADGFVLHLENLLSSVGVPKQIRSSATSSSSTRSTAAISARSSANSCCSLKAISATRNGRCRSPQGKRRSTCPPTCSLWG